MMEQIRIGKEEDKGKKQLAINEMLNHIRKSWVQSFNIMEVCGTHTRAIYHYGIQQLVEPKIKLLSGPGCPVCVTSEDYIDNAIQILQCANVIMATFGDMMKVSGNQGNLIEQREKGKDVRVVYSPFDVISLAVKNKNKEIVFLSVGFETTAPIIALVIKTVKELELQNLSFLISLKRMEPVLHHILSDANHNIQGMICPGHVAAVKGADCFQFVTEQYKIPAVVAGFEEVEIVSALYALTKQQEAKKSVFQNLYKSCVTSGGNIRANELMNKMFLFRDAEWRGVGNIKASELSLQKRYHSYDAIIRFGLELVQDKEKQQEVLQEDALVQEEGLFSEVSMETIRKKKTTKTCVCTDIILGKKLPSECSFFSKVCTPNHPLGPCMVSSEGACAVSYQYR